MRKDQYVAPSIRDQVDAPLPPEEFLRRVNAPLTAKEIESTRELVAWFTRRYPTVQGRFAYVRRTYRARTRAQEVRGPR